MVVKDLARAFDKSRQFTDELALPDRRPVQIVQSPRPVAAHVPKLFLRLEIELGTRLAHYTARSSIIFLISAIALAGFSPLGQVLAQFMIV